MITINMSVNNFNIFNTFVRRKNLYFYPKVANFIIHKISLTIQMNVKNKKKCVYTTIHTYIYIHIKLNISN